MSIIGGKYKHQILLALLWILIFICVYPLGEFPINDDWAYSHNVYDLSENGEFKFSFFPAMTLITQTLWGALFCKLFGFSFFILRISTVVLAIATSYLFYYFIKKQTSNNKTALFGTLILVVSPLFIAQSFTFMTEIPYLFFFFSSIILFTSYCSTHKTSTFVIAIVVSIMALMIRQTAMILPIAFGLVWFITNRKSFKTILISGIPFLIGIIALISYKQWRIATNNIEGSYSDVSVLLDAILNFDVVYFLDRAGVVLFYLGMLLLPVSITVFRKIRIRQRSVIRHLLFFLITLSFYFAMDGIPKGNVFYDFGLGPKILKDSSFWINKGFSMHSIFWTLLKISSFLSVLILLYFPWKKQKFTDFIKPDFYSTQSKKRNLFLVLIILGMASYLILNPIFFDRYTIPISSMLLLLILINIKGKLIYTPGLIVIGIMGISSVILSHDFYSWSRTKWEALNYLTIDKGISPTSIDGGIEFNGWNKAGPYNTTLTLKDKSWWFVTDDEYLISSGDFIEFRKIKSFSYQKLFPYTIDTIFILQKSSSIWSNQSSFSTNCDFENRSKDNTFILDSNNDAIMESYMTRNWEKHSGTYSLILNNNQKSGIIYQFDSLVPGQTITASIWRKGSNNGSLIITGSSIYQETNASVREDPGGWELLKINYTIPDSLSNCSFQIYPWNESPDNIYFDDLTIEIKE